MRFKRKLIEQNEQKVSILQLIGFVLIAIGVTVLLVDLFVGKVAPEVMALTFFLIMLGFAFAFPSLLKGNEGLSTMRIVVFMMTNVICILLLKIGWVNGIKSLKAIGLDQYWVGVIAFTFGAKAAQSFFESRLAVPSADPLKSTGLTGITFSGDELVKLAVAQNQDMLRIKFPNIVSISDTVNNLVSPSTNVVALYVKDKNTAGMPGQLPVRLPDNTIQTVATQIVAGVGNGKTHFGQLDLVANANGMGGSICCMVSAAGVPQALVTSGHVFSDDRTTSANGPISGGSAATVNGAGVGNWIFQLINKTTDVGLIGIDHLVPDPNYISFSGKGHYSVTNADVCKTAVTLVSNINKTRTGFIVDFNTTWPVHYADAQVNRSTIIVIGSTTDITNSTDLSKEGDSGGCVYEPVSGALVGIILGGDDMFTWVLPLSDLFSKQKFNLL